MKGGLCLKGLSLREVLARKVLGHMGGLQFTVTAGQYGRNSCILPAVCRHWKSEKMANG